MFRSFSEGSCQHNSSHIALLPTTVIQHCVTVPLDEIPVVSVSVITQDNKMRVVCEGEEEGEEEGEMRYHGVWLRHNCRCPQCYDHSAHNTLVRPHQLKGGNTHIEKVTVKGQSGEGN